jgi:hypothetical protein
LWPSLINIKIEIMKDLEESTMLAWMAMPATFSLCLSGDI